MEPLKLYMLILGATPVGRLVEQHDVFFGIAGSLGQLVPQIKSFWPEAHGKIHIDAWREVTSVNGHLIKVVEEKQNTGPHLFFINLGGYKPNDPEEYHYKILTVAASVSDAVKQAKQSAFFRHFGFAGAVSHVDNKYGIDVDDCHKVSDILEPDSTKRFSLRITASDSADDAWHVGYLPLSRLTKGIIV